MYAKTVQPLGCQTPLPLRLFASHSAGLTHMRRTSGTVSLWPAGQSWEDDSPSTGPARTSPGAAQMDCCHPTQRWQRSSLGLAHQRHQRGDAPQPEQKVRENRRVNLWIPLKTSPTVSKIWGSIFVIWLKYSHFYSVWNSKIFFPSPSLSAASPTQGARLITLHWSQGPQVELHSLQPRKLQRYCDPCHPLI